MKIPFLLATAFVLCSSLSPADEATPPTKLQKLNAAYERKRAEALRPVTAWYRAQLEALGREIQQEQRQVEQAKRQLAETFWADDQPELRAALLGHRWVWRSELDGVGVPVEFAADGSVQHEGLHGTWKITGPSEITVQPEDDGAFVLRFN